MTPLMLAPGTAPDQVRELMRTRHPMETRPPKTRRRSYLMKELAITCGYTYDEQELAGLRMLSPSAEVPPEATIYMDRGTIYWDIAQPDGRMSHMLATDGFLYTSKVPSESKAIKSEDVANGGGDELQKRLTKNAHDCKAYDGPASIFQTPTDITFVEIG